MRSEAEVMERLRAAMEEREEVRSYCFDSDDPFFEEVEKLSEEIATLRWVLGY